MPHIFAASTALLMFLAPPASDDLSADAQAHKGATTSAQGKVVQEYDFENDFVDGKTLSPDGVQVDSHLSPTFRSLITIRGTFTDQLIKLARDV
jgi:hypothetical protein